MVFINKGKRVGSVLLAVLLMLSLLLVSSEAHAATKKETRKRVIAIVFDNSGSMYHGSNNEQLDTWCRATYAMEVFAAMRNEGDVVLIYPMNPITIKGKKYTMDDPLKLAGNDDVSQIEEIVSETGGTPIETIGSAHSGLEAYSDYEKWMIVLTDGTEFWRNGGSIGAEATTVALTERLTEYSQYENVMYLGIGDIQNPPTINGSSANVVVARDSAQVLTELTRMCNTIYGRDTLSDDYKSDRSLKFDVSMSKLILFVQGTDIYDINVIGADVPLDSISVQYSSSEYLNNMTGEMQTPKVDESLSGMIVTYENLPAGTYDFSCSGNVTSVEVYYEPDVDLAVFLKKDGEILDMEGCESLEAGDYELVYGFIDANGNFTDSNLLGEREFELYINGEKLAMADSSQNGSMPITLEANTELELDIVGQFLGGYRIEKNNDDFGWAGSISIIPAPYTFTADVEGGADSYKLTDLIEHGSIEYICKLYVDGEQLTGDALKASNLELTYPGGNVTDCETTLTDEGYVIRIGTADFTGDTQYVIAGTATYTNEEGLARSDSFEIRITTEEVIFDYEMKLSTPHDRLVLMESDKWEALELRITMDGEPVSAETLREAAENLRIDGGDLLIGDAEIDEENGVIRIPIDKSGVTKKGRKVVSADTEVSDEIGRPVRLGSKVVLHVQTMPGWFWPAVSIACLILILAIIAAILQYIFTRLRLPNEISYDNTQTEFTVHGRLQGGNTSVKPREQGGTTGRVTITSPDDPNNPLAKCSITMDLAAVDKRYVKSPDRHAIVTKITTSSNVSSIDINGAMFDVVNGKLYQNGDPVQGPINVKIGKNSSIILDGSVKNPVNQKNQAINFAVIIKCI